MAVRDKPSKRYDANWGQSTMGIKSVTQKRGGAVQIVPLQLDSAETRYGQEPADPLTPEQCFERRWALALLDEVLSALRNEHFAAGTGEMFDALKPCLVGDRQAQPYAELAAKLGMTEGAVKVAVHRLRQRYRQLLREEIANTVANPAEVDEEMRHLFTVLAASNRHPGAEPPQLAPAPPQPASEPEASTAPQSQTIRPFIFFCQLAPNALTHPRACQTQRKTPAHRRWGHRGADQ